MPTPTKSTDRIEIPVRLDSAAFQDFSLFDVFRLRGRWRLPLAFALLMLGFACACFVLHSSSNQGILLGCLLLALGLILPLVYLLHFLRSIKQQCKAMGLDAPHGVPVYTVLLTQAGVTRRTPAVPAKKLPAQSTTVPYADLYGAWRTKTVTYLYLDSAHAVLLPNGQASSSDAALWSYLQTHLPASKCHEVK